MDLGSFPIVIPPMMTISTLTMASADFCLITCYVTMQSAVERPLVRQISPDKDVNFRYTTAAFLVASGDYPTYLRQTSLLNPGLRHVVLTHPETGPYMLSVCRLIALYSGCLQTMPRDNALAFS
jgi:hypothetical protein